MSDSTTCRLDHDDQFRLAPHGKFCLVDGEGCLIDLMHGNFAGLNASAASLLESLLAHGVRNTLNRKSLEWKVPESVVQRDINAVEGALQERGFLQNRETDAGSRLRRIGRRAFCLAISPWIKGLRRMSFPIGTEQQEARLVRNVLRTAWVCLRVLGLLPTVNLFRRSTASSAPPVEPFSLENLNSVIQSQAGRLLLPVACKERSLAAYFLLRARFGLAPTVVIGMQRHPFRAHAWVTWQDQFLTDHPEHCEFYIPVAELS